MDIINSVSFVFLTIAITINLILATSVLRSNAGSLTNKIYTLLSVVMSFWLVANYFSFQPFSNTVLNLWLIRLSLFFATPMNTLFLLFAKTVPEEKIGMDKLSLTSLVVLTGLVMVLTLSSLVFSGIKVENNIPSPITGLGIAVFGIFSIVTNVWAVFALAKRYSRSAGDKRQQLKMVMIGILTMFGLIIFTVFLPVVLFGVNIFVPLLPFYSVVFLALTAYAIVIYHLFNFKIIVVEALILGMWIFMGSRVLVGTSTKERVLDLLIFGSMIVFGVLLIRGIRREIEQREKLEVLTKQLESANDKLVKLDRLKSQFLSFASHQIKTPLAAIKGFASLICDGSYGYCPPRVSETSHKIEEAANRMISLVNEFLDLRKIEEGKMNYEIEKLDGVKLVGNVVDELKSLAQAKGLDLSFEFEKESIQVNADSQRIRQVFQNLIENSIKYTDNGFVKVGIKTFEGNFVFSVSDSGHGIETELLPDLFEEFKRAGNSDTKKIEGTGLGLFIAKQIVIGHKGQILVESEGPGKGSKFTVKIPLV